MKFRDLAGNVATGLAVCSAVTVAGLAVRREFFPPVHTVDGRHPPKPKAVDHWEKYASVGHRIGPPTAPVTIVEFADFECPVCGRFTNTALRGIRAKYPADVAIVFRHWPLPYHKFAMPSAKAAECAGAQGRFEAFHDLLYAKQDSLGLKPFAQFAQESGVPDSVVFGACERSVARVSAIEADTAAVALLGGTGTPTVMINGALYSGAPDSTVLDQIVSTELAKRRKRS